MRTFLNRFRPRVVRRMAKSEDGAAAVEFALVAFPFFMIMGCICETGIMLFTEYSIQAGVQEAARQIKTGQAQNASMSAAVFLAGLKLAQLSQCWRQARRYAEPDLLRLWRA